MYRLFVPFMLGIALAYGYRRYAQRRRQPMPGAARWRDS